MSQHRDQEKKTAARNSASNPVTNASVCSLIVPVINPHGYFTLHGPTHQPTTLIHAHTNNPTSQVAQGPGKGLTTLDLMYAAFPLPAFLQEAVSRT
jgi:hypothetical protein